jgi:trehalose 6-phosphate synthase/phosphatase
MATKYLDQKTIDNASKSIKSAEKTLFFLDYDGTLVRFSDTPDKAVPDKELMAVLKKLTANPKYQVVIISGRDRNTLESWLGHLNLDFIGEHGVWLKERGKEWRTITKLSGNWKNEIKSVLELYVDRTPGSFIEEKDYSLVWHHRKVETGLGELRTRELSSHLKYLSSNMNLQVMEGDMVVEIKSALVNKGRAAQQWIADFPSDYVVAIGDDWTDEDTFRAMPEDALTIKVGSTSSAAKYNLNAPDEVREFLKHLY